MKNTDSTKKASSRRSFIKSVTLGGGALYLLGKVGNSLAAQDFEVFSDPNRARDINGPIGACKCGSQSDCSGSGGGGQCKCGDRTTCSGGGS